MKKQLLTWRLFSRLIERSLRDFVHVTKWLLTWLPIVREVSMRFYPCDEMVANVAPHLAASKEVSPHLAASREVSVRLPPHAEIFDEVAPFVHVSLLLGCSPRSMS